jgi:hypothetical protein
MLGWGGEQEACEDAVDGQCEDLMSHAERRLGVELALVELDRLAELAQFFGLPTQSVELGDLRVRDV